MLLNHPFNHAGLWVFYYKIVFFPQEIEVSREVLELSLRREVILNTGNNINLSQLLSVFVCRFLVL